MQRFELQIFVADFLSDRHQLFTQDLDLFEPPVARRIQVQSQGRLERLGSRMRLQGERFRLLQRRSRFGCLRPFVNGERGSEFQLGVQLEACSQFRVGDTLCLPQAPR